MKQIVLLTGVNMDGYGGIENISTSDCKGLLDAICDTDRGQCLALVYDGINLNSYVIKVNKQTIALYAE